MVKIPPFREDLPDGSIKYNFTPPQMRAMQSPARFTALLCGAQFGKALDEETPIPTVNGFKPLRDIVIGDEVFDENGNTCLVTGVTGTMFGHKCYKVVFDDGSDIVADAGHLWRTQTYKQRKNQSRWLDNPSRNYKRGDAYGIVTTEDIMSTLVFHNGANHSIAYPLPAKYPDRDLPIPPYTLGAWLGDGTARTPHITCADTEILDAIRSEGVQVSEGIDNNSGKALQYSLDVNKRGSGTSIEPLILKLKGLNLYHNKHIPGIYLISSPEQRLNLLQGLMDTDGSVSPQSGACELTLKDNQLAHDAVRLMRSLGIKTRIYDKHIEGYGNFIRVSFTTNLDVFRLPRKRNIHQGRKRRADTNNRYIDAVIECDSVPVRCIAVDSPSHLYLAGENYIPTHNTVLGPPWMYGKMQQYGAGDWIAGTTNFPLLDKKMLPAYEELFHHKLGVARYNSKGNKMVFNDGKSTIFFFTAEKPASMESATAICGHFDEVGQDEWKEKTWDACLSRLAIASNPVEEGGLGAGEVLLTTTLYNFGWLKYKVYDEWVRGNPLYNVIHADSIENPTFPIGEYYRLKAEISESEFDLRYRGRYTKPKGLIYDSFDSKTCVLNRSQSPVQPSWPRYCGMDFGNDTAAIFYAVDPNTGIYYADAEYLAAGRSTAEHVEKLKEMSKGWNVIRCLGGKGDIGEDGWRNDFTSAGWPVQMPTIRDVWVGISRVYAFHKLNKIVTFSDMTNYLAEKTSYSRKLDERSVPIDEVMNKQRYHIMDSEKAILSSFNLSSVKYELRPIRVGFGY